MSIWLIEVIEDMKLKHVKLEPSLLPLEEKATTAWVQEVEQTHGAVAENEGVTGQQ